MGVDLYVLDMLLRYRGRNIGDVLMLGRQGFNVSKNEAALAMLAKADHTPSYEDLSDATGYSEKLFSYLGARSVTSLDAALASGEDFYQADYAAAWKAHAADEPAVTPHAGALIAAAEPGDEGKLIFDFRAGRNGSTAHGEGWSEREAHGTLNDRLGKNLGDGLTTRAK